MLIVNTSLDFKISDIQRGNGQKLILSVIIALFSKNISETSISTNGI